jgi:hypothetical protein
MLTLWDTPANYASAFAIELRRGEPPDTRDFLRFKFKNGTSGEFRTVHTFGHKDDIPLTEFIYRIEASLITSASCLIPTGFSRILPSPVTVSGCRFALLVIPYLLGLESASAPANLSGSRTALSMMERASRALGALRCCCFCCRSCQGSSSELVPNGFVLKTMR